MEPSLIADLVARLLALPAERVTVWHFLFLTMGGLCLVAPGIVRSRHHARHVEFIRTATPEQLAAYTGHHKLPPPSPPSVGGPVLVLALVLVLGLIRGSGLSVASAEDSSECRRDRDCPAGQYCNRGSCVSNARRPNPRPKAQMAAREPLGLAWEERDPERPSLGWLQRNL